MCAPGHAEWDVCLLLGKWSASPTLGRRQFVMRAAECVDRDRARGQTKRVTAEGWYMEQLNIGLQRI